MVVVICYMADKSGPPSCGIRPPRPLVPARFLRTARLNCKYWYRRAWRGLTLPDKTSAIEGIP